MSGQPLEGHKITSNGLYLRTRAGVMGPYTVEVLRRMALGGILPSRGAVSVDKKKWRLAGSFRELFDENFNLPGDHSRSNRKKAARKTPEKIPAEEILPGEKELQIGDELRRLLKKISKRKRFCYLASTPVVALFFLAVAGILLYASASFSGLLEVFTWKRFWSFLSFGVPALLGLLAVISMGGSLLFYKLFGLSETERRFLALYLQPSALEKLGWGALLRDWLLRGDWLFCRARKNPGVYLHVFYHGLPRRGLAGEVALWEDLAQAAPYSLRSLCLPGGSIRQVQTVASLPHWSTLLNEVTEGRLLSSLLDQNFSRWAEKLLAQARKRLQLNASAPVRFFLSFIEISEGKEALAVCVYPDLEAAATDNPPVAAEIAA